MILSTLKCFVFSFNYNFGKQFIYYYQLNHTKWKELINMKDILQMMGNQGHREVQFGETAMGHRYLNNTVPELVWSVKRLSMAINQEKLLSSKEINVIQENVKRLAMISVQNNDFHRTRMGINYYQNQIPEFTKALKNLVSEKKSEAEIKQEALEEKKAKMLSQKEFALKKIAETDDIELISFYSGQIELIDTFFA